MDIIVRENVRSEAKKRKKSRFLDLKKRKKRKKRNHKNVGL